MPTALPPAARRMARLALAVACARAPTGCGGGQDGVPDGLPVEVPMVQVAARAYPTRSAFFRPAKGPHPNCRRPDRSFALADYMFFAELGRVPVGEVTDVGPFVESSAENWENMGFAAAGPGRWRRAAPLDEVAPLVPTEVPELPTIDAIAITSIDRHNGQRPYIYDTLKALFSVLPVGAQVNVLVGNDDAAYLSPRALGFEGLAPDLVERVHVHPSDPRTATFLADAFVDSVRRRASWNYARALRSYAGRTSMLFLEDDVDWATHALRHLSRAQAEDPLPVVSLFDHVCRELEQPVREDYRQGRRPFVVTRPGMRHVSFYCTQAMLYSADVANELGRFLQPRMHEQGYDEVINRFLHRHGVQLGYAQPSLVQHTGRDSTGLSVWFPHSKCFVPELAPAAWPNETSPR